MLSEAHYFFILFVMTAAATVVDVGPHAYNATELILLNCGESSVLKDTSNRSWSGDHHSRYAPPNAAAISRVSRASFSSVIRLPYDKALVFNSSFTYGFPLLPGPKFLRLHFYPDVFSDYNTSHSFFSVTANGFTLFENFSPYLYSLNSSEPAFMKEFVIYIQENQNLDLTFIPNSNSAAYVNGIEIVSIPDELYFKGNNVPLKFVGQLFYLNNRNTALENVYRLNVGGSRVEIQDDSGPTRGMFRAWDDDSKYLAGDPNWTPHNKDVQIKYNNENPPYTAPETVYKSSRALANNSKSIDWHFPVDSGFMYLLRFHFCEIQPEVTLQNQRVFTISVNNKTEEIQADIIFWTGANQTPVFRDYIANVPDDGPQHLLLSLFPNLEGQPKYSSALLNGLEIFKLSDDNRSLAAVKHELVMGKHPGKKNIGHSSVIYAVVGSLLFVLALVAATFLILKRQKNLKDSIPKKSNESGLPINVCRYFSLDEIKTATRNFDQDLVIGRGGFGNVYKGLIDKGSTTVAIKRLNPSSNQGAQEFFNEIDMLSKFRYVHLVSLIGYCNQHGEMILIYDYMAHGTLRDHLYNSKNSPLTWNQRLQISLGAAKGLNYLHYGTDRAIIHRDVKSTNILLNHKWVAKISDFGLSKLGPTGGDHTHISTAVKGSFGYLDPEYYRWQQLTEKSDVYSFGVVLLEVLCARPALNTSLPREQANLAEWAKHCVAEGTLKQIIDSSLDGQIAHSSLNRFVQTAIACLKDKGTDRPTMTDVVRSLELAIQLQDAVQNRNGTTTNAGGDEENFVALSSPSPLFFPSSETAGCKTNDLPTDSCKKEMSEDVFTEIIHPLGR